MEIKHNYYYNNRKTFSQYWHLSVHIKVWLSVRRSPQPEAALPCAAEHEQWQRAGLWHREREWGWSGGSGGWRLCVWHQISTLPRFISHTSLLLLVHTLLIAKFAHISLNLSFMVFKLFEMTNVSSDQIENATLFIYLFQHMYTISKICFLKKYLLLIKTAFIWSKIEKNCYNNSFLFYYTLKHNLFLWCKAAITPVFTFTWCFRNPLIFLF